MASLIRRRLALINCCSELGVDTLLTALRGACSEGSWVLFDEINRTKEDDLKLLGMWLTQIHNGLAAREDSLSIMGKNFHLEHSFGFFSALNPGYLGRTQLPPNLSK